MTETVDRAASVLYVLGMYRSGTTLLGNLLGQAPGYVSVGELRGLWRNVNDPVARCGCGCLIRDCPFWDGVLGRVLGSDKAGGAALTSGWASWLWPIRHGWLRAPALLWAPGRVLRSRPALLAYRARLTDTYHAISLEASGAVVVDSSKEAVDAVLASTAPGVNVRFVQIVRDPRGVVNSHLRATGAIGAWRLVSVVRVSLSWLVVNLTGFLVGRLRGRSRTMIVRYEDLVSDPRAVLSRIVGTEVVLHHDETGKARIEECHTADGNPSRMRQGYVDLELDESWRRELSRAELLLTRMVTSPLGAWFRY